MRPPVCLVLVLLLVALWARQNPEQLKVRIYNGLAVRRRCKVQKAAANFQLTPMQNEPRKGNMF